MRVLTLSLTTLALSLSLAMPATAALNNSYATSNFVLELDGKAVSYLSSVEGGQAIAEVITEANSPQPLEKKHLAAASYQDLSLRVNGTPAKPLIQWIQELLSNQQKLRTGAIVELDLNGRMLSRLEFVNAQLKQVQLPGVDASSKQPVSLGLVISPSQTRQVAASGVFSLPTDKTKPLLASNFRFTLAGLENSSKFTTSIAPIVISQSVASTKIGQVRNLSVAAPTLSYGPLQVSLSQTAIEPIQNWFSDFVIKGNNADSQEKTATLDYLSADMKSVLLSLSFKGVGIYQLNRDYSSLDSQSLRRSQASLYLEGVELK